MRLGLSHVSSVSYFRHANCLLKEKTWSGLWTRGINESKIRIERIRRGQRDATIVDKMNRLVAGHFGYVFASH